MSSRRVEYETLLAEIADLKQKKLALERQQEPLQERSAVIYAKLVLEVAAARDEKGKPVFSNEEVRRAALTLKLDEHSEHRQIQEKLRGLRHALDDIILTLNNLIDRKFLLMVELGIPAEAEREKYMH